MATDKEATWSLGESILWYSPNTTLDATWSLGESRLVDEYVITITKTDSLMGLNDLSSKRIDKSYENFLLSLSDQEKHWLLKTYMITDSLMNLSDEEKHWLLRNRLVVDSVHSLEDIFARTAIAVLYLLTDIKDFIGRDSGVKGH